jgi:tRNA A-37 threonylcarbamoyl transferase component Bud32
MPGLKVIRAAMESDGDAWAAALGAGLWREKARVLKRDGGTVVYRVRLLDRDVVIKCWAMGPKARLQALIGGTRGMRQWRGAASLRKCGVATAWTWALLRGSLDGQRVECLVMEALQGKTVLQRLADGDLSVKQQHAVARALGEQVSGLAHQQVFNRDHKPSNLILVDPGKSVSIAVIDCVDIQRGRFGPEEMLSSLLIESLGVGLRPRLAIRMRVAHACTRQPPESFAGGHRHWLRQVWRKVEAIVRDHGDPTPHVSPLDAAL